MALNLPIPLLMLSEWLFEGDTLDADDWTVMLVFFIVAVFYALPFTGRLLRRFA